VVARTEEALVAAGSKRAHQQLRIVRDRMLAALEDAGLEVVDPEGRPFDDVVDLVDVIGWRHGPQFPAQVVAETIEPIVLHDNALVRTGRVIMGGPEENSD
jgi:molecular chaperone GrpE (heat shock protein)